MSGKGFLCVTLKKLWKKGKEEDEDEIEVEEVFNVSVCGTGEFVLPLRVCRKG